jgi:hypothetical protein
VLVSVIVPLYNKGPHIKRCLASILTQSHSDLEVIVVDDGSTDGGGLVAAATSDGRLRLIQQPNAGPGAARNRGLAEARGQYVAFLDADDDWLPDFLESALSQFASHGPETAAVTSAYFQYPQGHSTVPMWHRRGLREGLYRLTSHTPPQLAASLLIYMSCCTTLARTDIVRRWGGFYTQDRCVYGEDSYLWLKVLLNHPVAVHLQPLVRIHTEASALSCNLRGPRPVEPLLVATAGLEEACPPDLSLLLRNVLAIRALKTACMLSYWGRWRQGQALLRQFGKRATAFWPLFEIGRLAASPLGSSAGSLLRLFSGTLAPVR